MATVHDVAAYILKKAGAPITTWKLQKLLYYCQAWSLVWEERPIFKARIEAWANGPVIPEIYKLHRGQFKIDSWTSGDASRLSPDDADTVDRVVLFYGHRTSQWLSDLSHHERPWKEARIGLGPGERGTQEITLASMHEYYSSLSA